MVTLNLSSVGSALGVVASVAAFIAGIASAFAFGVDVSSAVDEATWKCLQSPGGQGPVEFAVVRVYRSTGTVDPSGAATIKAARAALIVAAPLGSTVPVER